MKGVWLNVTCYPASFCERLKKTRTSVGQFGVSTEIRKKHLSNAVLKCCEYNFFTVRSETNKRGKEVVEENEEEQEEYKDKKKLPLQQK